MAKARTWLGGDELKAVMTKAGRARASAHRSLCVGISDRGDNVLGTSPGLPTNVKRHMATWTNAAEADPVRLARRAPSFGEHNTNTNEQMIREQAYGLWDHAGRPDGRSDEFWFAGRAECERREETGEGNLSAHVPPHVEAVSSWIER